MTGQLGKILLQSRDTCELSLDENRKPSLLLTTESAENGIRLIKDALTISVADDDQRHTILLEADP